MVYTLRLFSSKCSLFHNSNVFGSCMIHILYTGRAKIKKNNSGPKRLRGQEFQQSIAGLPQYITDEKSGAQLDADCVTPGLDVYTTLPLIYTVTIKGR